MIILCLYLAIRCVAQESTAGQLCQALACQAPTVTHLTGKSRQRLARMNESLSSFGYRCDRGPVYNTRENMCRSGHICDRRSCGRDDAFQQRLVSNFPWICKLEWLCLPHEFMAQILWQTQFYKPSHFHLEHAQVISDVQIPVCYSWSQTDMNVLDQPACVLGCSCATSELPKAYCMCLHTLPSVHTSLEFHVTSDLQGSVNLQRSFHAEAGTLTRLLQFLGAACAYSEAGYVRLQVLTVRMQGSQIEIVPHNNKQFHTYFRKRRYLFWHLWTCVGKFLVTWMQVPTVTGFSCMPYLAVCRGFYYPTRMKMWVQQTPVSELEMRVCVGQMGRARQILASMMPATLVRQIAQVLHGVAYWNCPLHCVCPDSARIQDVKRVFHECGTELSTVYVNMRRMPLDCNSLWMTRLHQPPTCWDQVLLHCISHMAICKPAIPRAGLVQVCFLRLGALLSDNEVRCGGSSSCARATTAMMTSQGKVCAISLYMQVPWWHTGHTLHAQYQCVAILGNGECQSPHDVASCNSQVGEVRRTWHMLKMTAWWLQTCVSFAHWAKHALAIISLFSLFRRVTAMICGTHLKITNMAHSVLQPFLCSILVVSLPYVGEHGHCSCPMIHSLSHALSQHHALCHPIAQQAQQHLQVDYKRQGGQIQPTGGAGVHTGLCTSLAWGFLQVCALHLCWASAELRNDTLHQLGPPRACHEVLQQGSHPIQIWQAQIKLLRFVLLAFLRACNEVLIPGSHARQTRQVQPKVLGLTHSFHSIPFHATRNNALHLSRLLCAQLGADATHALRTLCPGHEAAETCMNARLRCIACLTLHGLANSDVRALGWALAMASCLGMRVSGKLRMTCRVHLCALHYITGQQSLKASMTSRIQPDVSWPWNAMLVCCICTVLACLKICTRLLDILCRCWKRITRNISNTMQLSNSQPILSLCKPLRNPITCFRKTSPLGPKSEGSSHSCGNRDTSIGFIRKLLLVVCLVQTATGARVAGASTTPAEAITMNQVQPAHTLAKPSGNFNLNAQHTFARKRAYKRAVRRAQENCTTWYRGKRCTYNQLVGNQPWPEPVRDQQKQARSIKHQGVWILSWNVGGLSTAILDEIQVWLSKPENAHFKVVMLQETRWQFSSDWSNSKWSFVHSGHTKQKGSGVLTMISSDLTHSDDIRAREVVHGRVLHTRIKPKDRQNCIDLVNVYQHAWDTRANAQDLSTLRLKIMHAVEDTVRTIPLRNLCICAGDFNVQLKSIRGHVGANTVLKANDKQAAPDSDILHDMIHTLNLVALNTWTGLRRQAFTFEHQGYRSQIDYVFVRKHEATPIMRQCRPLHGFPITAWRLSGLHIPLCVCVDSKWKPQYARDRPTRIDTDQVKDALLRQTSVMQQFRQAVAQQVGNASNYCAETFNKVLLQQGAVFFPDRRNTRRAAYEEEGVQRIIKCRWKHLRMSKQYAQSPCAGDLQYLNQMFQSWLHFAKFRNLRREANRASRAARRNRLENLIADAEQCATTLNMHKLFRVVRQIAPKQPYKKIKLYGPQGEILSVEQEARSIKEHFEAILHDSDQPIASLEHRGAEAFSVADLQSELEHIPLNKATPRHLAPGALWRAAAPIIAPVLAETLHRQWNTVASVPQPWKDGWVALALKPNKPGRDPGDFRPLCLQDHVGKAVLKLVATRIKPIIQTYARDCPQHAYLPGRSTEGALLAVFDKCREIRTIAQAARRDIFAKRQGVKASPYAGGLILSLDMSMAFDIVPRCHVQASLLEAGVDESDVALIMEWLQGCTYYITHGHINLKVVTERGVRQGCVLSPLIWTCFTCFVVKRLDKIVSLQDLQIYADDFLMTKIFHTKEQFVSALKSIPVLMQHLRNFGLRINVNKTAVLIRMAQRDGRNMLKQHLCQNKDGVYLRTLEAQAQFLPVKSSHKYLGCIISLHDFEALTFQHRLELGRNQFSRLRSVLMSHRCLTLSKRAYMWQVCVWTTLSYGLACCGCASLQLQRLSGIVAKQLRSVARMPRHITHTTNAEIHDLLKVPTPAKLLEKASDSLVERLQRIVTQAEPDDVMLWPSIHRQATWSAHLIRDAAQHDTQLVRALNEEAVPCPICGLYFAGQTGLRKHISRKHPDADNQVTPQEDIKRELHCVDGMPVCRGCGKRFHHMQTLLRHVRMKRCTGSSQTLEPAPGKVEPVPLSQRKELVRSWIQGGSQALLASLDSVSELRKEMREHCCICRQWIADPRHIKLHIRITHSEVYNSLHDDTTADCKQLTGAITSSCSFCGVPSLTNKSRHATGCTVLYQAALCCRIHGQFEGTGNSLSLRGAAACSEQVSCNEQNKPSRGHGGEPAPQVAKAEGQRARSERTEGTKQTSLFAFMARRGRSERKPGDPDADTALPSSGGQYQCDAYGPRVSDAVQDQGPGDDATDLQGHSGQVERTPRGRHHGSAAPSGNLQVYGFGTPKQSQASDGDKDGGAGQTGLGDQEGQHGALLASHDVQSGEEARCASAGHRSSATFGRRFSPGKDHTEHGRPNHTTIPCNQALSGQLHGRHASLHVGGFDQGTRTDQSAPSIGQVGQLHDLVFDRRSDASRHTEALSLGGQAPGRVAESVLTLALHNYGNTCYQNSFALSWGWSWAACAMLQGWQVLNNDRLGTCAPILLALYSGAHRRLSNILAWTQVLQTWRRPQDQHDVGEFASHALSRLRPLVMHGHWVSRVEDPVLRNTDTGVLHMPLAISIPLGATNLQDCVDAWQSQSHVHALLDVPPLLLLQLGRFRHRSHRHVTKLRVEIDIEGTLAIPVFDHGLVTRTAQYRVVGGVLHIGGTPSSGHYRSFLSSFAGMPERSALDQAYITDDGQVAHPLNAEERRLICANAYLIWCAKC